MAEYFWGSIAIGGKVNKDLVPDLLKVLQQEINDHTPEDIQNDLGVCLIKPQRVEFTQSDARWGEFEDTQAFCQKHKIVYLVKSAADLESDACMKYFDGNEEIEVTCNQDFDPSIGKYHFKTYLKHIKDMCADLTLVPLKLESKYFHEKEVARTIAKLSSTDPLTVLEAVIESRFPDVGGIPELEFI